MFALPKNGVVLLVTFSFDAVSVARRCGLRLRGGRILQAEQRQVLAHRVCRRRRSHHRYRRLCRRACRRRLAHLRQSHARLDQHAQHLAAWGATARGESTCTYGTVRHGAPEAGTRAQYVVRTVRRRLERAARAYSTRRRRDKLICTSGTYRRGRPARVARTYSTEARGARVNSARRRAASRYGPALGWAAALG